MLDKILPQAKAWAALVGAIVTALSASVPGDSIAVAVLTPVAAVCTAFATFAIPNRTRDEWQIAREAKRV